LACSFWSVRRLHCIGARKFGRVFRRSDFAHEWLRLFGVAPIAIGIKKLFTNSNVHLKGASAGAIDVAIVTFVNGADNIGIYTPLFAVSDARRLIVLVAVLYVLLAAWCIVGYVIHRQKTVAYSLQRWGIGPCPQFLSALAFTSC
jgi:cadmium resistance protein CadD (predicted permease)